MDDRFNKFLIGSFVIVLITALASIVMWLSLSDRRQGYDAYFARFTDSVSGLNEEASIKFRGVDVGRVKEIKLDPADPSRVRVVMEIRPETPIRSDTVAVLSSLGITGLAYIELTGGSRNASELTVAPGEKYPEISTGPSLFTRIDTTITQVMTELGTASGQLNTLAERLEIVMSDKNTEAAGEILQNVRALSGHLLNEVDSFKETLANVDRISSSVAASAEQLPALIENTGEAIAAFETASAGIADASSAVTSLSATAGTEMSAWSQTLLPQLTSLTSEVATISRSLNRALAEFERNPNALVYGRPSPEPGPGE